MSSHNGSAVLRFIGVLAFFLFMLAIAVLVGVALPLTLALWLANTLTGSAATYVVVSEISSIAFKLGAIGCLFFAVSFQLNSDHLSRAVWNYLVFGWVGGIVGLILACMIPAPPVLVVSFTAVLIALVASYVGLNSAPSKNDAEYNNRNWPNPDY